MQMLKLFFFSFLILLPASAAPAQPGVTPTSSSPEKKLVIEVEIPAPVHDVWLAFTTSEGLVTWLAPKATVDLRPGGNWIVSFPGRSSTGGGSIVSFIPEKELVLAALAPDQFPHVRAERTMAVFTFEPRGDATMVRLTQTGWKTGKEWDRAYEYLVAGNAELLSTLYHRFAEGPIDWRRLAAPAANSGDKEQK
ncbi:Activator of Hsp90 ATPase 1 family protein [Candidatus Sulfotelmatomonas gaucii]|uniref:Activator of Hsp90 ATPase 1 family protein n=1 Tax=Candidatus Sulfuritelmatomonas gaucii TaxID=2043161 RepID=A0A2N9L7T0_9BACT|nr:Activator of Hsp90 ATPase 1 family protein [Candidatus Sulfotelmatomonas gaucii]